MIRPDVPIMNSNVNETTRPMLLEQIRGSAAERVWIALDRYTFFADRTRDMELLRENLRYFEENGFEVGVWMQAFGFGDPLPYDKCGWTRLRSVGGVSKEADMLCPEDPDFVAAYLDWVRDIASLSPRLIMLDDDLCLSVRPGIGCFCDRHLRLLEDKVGKISDLTRIFTGGPNPYRDAWYKVMGNSLRGFCKKVRAAVDEIDPTIRVGLCAGYTSWDIEGTDPIELSKLLAGSTAPFFRLTAAPYWVAPKTNRFNGQRLSAVIENARNQIAWSKDTGIEFFAEADSYPRPAYTTPAMLVENFDIAMHASGTKSLKYLFDYHSSPRYEQQYLKIHRRNLPLYEAIESEFANATPCGVRVYRPAHRIRNAILPTEFAGEKAIMRTYFSSAAAMLACHAIPVCYDGESDCAMVFGDDAMYLKDTHKKVVLDRSAALLLKERGVDVGIEAVTDAPTPAFEYFEGEKVLLGRINAEATFKDLTLKAGATIHSRYDTNAIASFTYGKFLILNIDAFTVNESTTLFCSYARGKQLQSFFGYPFPSVSGYADLYSICAARDNTHISLFQNLSIDPVFDFDITLPKPCKAFRLYGAEGECSGNTIHVTTDFLPQGTMMLVVEYE